MIYLVWVSIIALNVHVTLQTKTLLNFTKQQKFINEGNTILQYFSYDIIKPNSIILNEFYSLILFTLNCRLKDLAQKQYSQNEADLGAGRSTEILPPAHAALASNKQEMKMK